ncbi:hypothetical protein D3C80_2014720 [compost metagenome]
MQGAEEEGAALLEAARECRVPLRVLSLHEPHLAQLYERRLLLVRPDQHVCWRGDRLPDDCYLLLNRLRGVR